MDTQDTRIAVIGTGYVGLISSVCFASLGYKVTGLDVQKEVVRTLNGAISTIYEQGLQELLQAGIEKKLLSYTTDYQDLSDIDLAFICVGTPPLPNGQADLRHVYSVLTSLAQNLAQDAVVVVRSTIPLGTMQSFKSYLADKNRSDITLCFNPEFLREGSAVHDFFNPDRIVISSESIAARTKLEKIYAPLVQKAKTPPALIICPRFETAELAKYANNAFLSTKISFTNQLALLAKDSGAEMDQVVEILGSDFRISPHFFKPGPGFGGSCFPKDVRSLVYQGHKYGVEMSVVNEAIESNMAHMRELATRCIAASEHLTVPNACFAIWGLAFKANTDDVRESPALYILKEFVDKGIKLQVYDPKAMDNFGALFPEKNIFYAQSPLAACHNADSLIVLTEWDEFSRVLPSAVKDAMRNSQIFDFRSVLESDSYAKLGITINTL